MGSGQGWGVLRKSGALRAGPAHCHQGFQRSPGLGRAGARGDFSLGSPQPAVREEGLLAIGVA